MIHAINFKHQQQTKLKRFKEFIFIGSNLVDSSNTTKQMHLNPNSIFLAQIEVGNSIAIEGFCASKNMIRQLNSLGLKPGKIVKVMSKTGNGSVVLALKDISIGIGTEIARQIMVTAIDETL